MLIGAERPNSNLFTVKLVSCFVDVNYVSLLDLDTDLLVLAATGARSVLGRALHGREARVQTVELIKQAAIF